MLIIFAFLVSWFTLGFFYSFCRAVQDGLWSQWNWCKDWHCFCHAPTRCWCKLGKIFDEQLLRFAFLYSNLFPDSHISMAHLDMPFHFVGCNCTWNGCIIIKPKHETLAFIWMGYSFVFTSICSLPVKVQLYSPRRPVVDVAEVFLWLMAVGTILCASYWSAWSAREVAIEQDKLLKVILGI